MSYPNTSDDNASDSRQRRVASQLVGRQAELQVMTRRIENLGEGRGRFVALIGEAGIGKSRFIAELRNQVCGLSAKSPVLWLEGTAAAPMEKAAAYGLFSRIIEQYAGIAEHDSQSDAWDKLQSRISPLFGGRSAEVLPYFATMMAAHVRNECVEKVGSLDGETISREIFRATEQFFESISRKRPLVLALEDMHCIDESSVALLQHLLPLIFRASILILGVGRPPVETPCIRLREVLASVYHNFYDEIRLPPLSPRESAQLAAMLMRDDSHALAVTDTVLQKAKGTPLLIEQTIESLIRVDYDHPRTYVPERLAEKILAARGTIDGERKFVTVMFAGVEGLSSIAEKLGPDQVRRIMHGCYRILMDEVHACEGTIIEFRNDGTVALFGAPIASEEHAQRACYACAGILKALVPFGKNLKKRFGIDFKVCVGLNSGPVAVRSIGDNLRMDFTAQENTTDIASAMESLAEPGTVLVSERTYGFAKNLFEFQPLGKFVIKGQEHAVQAYRLTDKACVAKEGSEREAHSAMIGRDQELAELELQVLKAANGESSVVNVIGDAGIGKSRLVAELKKRGVAKGLCVLEGRSVSIGRNLSFHPFIELLRNWAYIREDDTEKAATDKLEVAIVAVCPHQAEEVFPFVATMMGMKLRGKHAVRVRGIGGEPLERLIFKNIRDLLIGLTDISPTVVVMEDLHWADASSLLLLDFIYGLALTQKIVFLNVFRPGYWDTDDGIVGNVKARMPGLRVLSVHIQPLDPQGSEALIDSILNIKGLQHDVKEQIVERASGNPYFIEEMVRSLIADGAVKAVESGFEVTEKIDAVIIPSTINEAVMARISKLDEQSRNVVKVASVIGRSFFHRILADVTGSVKTLDAALAHLKQMQFLREQIRMEELEYSFQHALAQEAVYASIPLQQRKELHAKVAESIEQIFSERLHEFCGTLAYHFGSAGNPEKTEDYLIKAGEEALKSAAASEALEYYQEALAMYRKLRGSDADPEKVAMFEKNIGLALFNRGHYTEAVEHFDLALNYYWGKLPKNTVSRAFRFLSGFVTLVLSLYFPSLYFKRIPTDRDIQAEKLIAKKLESLGTTDAERYFIEFSFYLTTCVRFDLTKTSLGAGGFAGIAGLFIWSGLSLGIARRILDYAKPMLPIDDAKQWLRYDLEDTLYRSIKGDWTEITDYNQDMVDRILRIGAVWDAIQHCFWHGIPKVFQGDFDAAKSMVSKLSEIAEAYDNDIGYFHKYILNCYLLVECRRLHEALDELNRAIDLARKVNPGTLVEMYAMKAVTHLLMKDTEEAGRTLDQANRIGAGGKIAPLQLATLYRAQFEYNLRLLEGSLASGSGEQSCEHRRHALASGKMLTKSCRKAPVHTMETCRLMGRYMWLVQDRKGAFKLWQEAIREGERLGARPQLARTYAEIAVRTWPVRSELPTYVVREVEAYFEQAKVMFNDLGLRYDLDELNSAIRKRSFGPFDA